MDYSAAIADAAEAATPISFTATEIVPGRWLLVDADYLAYFCSGNNETPIGDARTRMMQKLDDMRIAAGAEKVVCHLTATGSHKGWRYVIATQQPYQGHRDGSTRPKNWEQLRDFLESYKGLAFTPKIWGTREADDGICLHTKLLAFGRAVVAMKDKDSQMFDGCIHLDWDTYEMTEVPKGTYEIENSTGRLFGSKWFWVQLLAGDSADKIPGLPQILSHTGKMVDCGMARAKNALCMTHDDPTAFDVVCKHYAHFYKEDWADRLVEQMGLLWMRTDKNAEITDFLTVVPGGNKFHSHVTEAAARLTARVQEVINATPDY
jgi:hypothetical protein